MAARRRFRSLRLGRTVRRQVSREVHRLSALAVLGLLAPILLFDLTLLADLLVNRGFEAAKIAGLVALRTVPAFAVAIPPAVLIAVVAALARMRAYNELVALESSGVALLRLAVPVLGAALVWSAVAAALALEWAPAAHRRVNAWLAAAALENPTAVLQSGRIQSFANLRVRAREVSADGASLAGVALWLPSIDTTVFARRASVLRQPGEPAVVALREGRILFPDGDAVSRVDFETLEQELIPEAPVQVEDPLAAFSAAQLWREVRDSNARAPCLEWHRRLGAAASTLTLAALGFSLGLGAPGRSRAGALLAAAAALLGHYGLVQLGEGLARDPTLPPTVVWLPQLLVLLLALALLRTRPPRGSGRRRRASTRRGRIRLHRFALDRDWARRFFEFSALCALAGVVVGALLDVLDNLKWFTQYQAELREILNFYRERIPILFSRVFPLALTTAAGLAMGSAAAAGELTAARACGFGPLRTITPITVACLLAAGFQQELANQWVPRFSARASEIKQLEIKNRSRVQHGTWHPSGETLFEIGTLDPVRGVATDVVFYQLDGGGLPYSRTRAATARHVGEGSWLLEDPERLELRGAGLRSVPAALYEDWDRDLTASVDTGDLTLSDLRREIERARRDGYDPRHFEVDLQARLAAPLACLVLPTLVLLFAAAGPPFPKTGRIVLVGLALAVAHGLGSSVTAALGYGGFLPPAVAGWLALAVLSAGGFAWALRAGFRP